MLHRSFLLGLVTIACVIVIGVAAVVWIAPRVSHPSSRTNVRLVDFVDLDLEPGLPGAASSSTEVVFDDTSTTTMFLHEPPLARLLRIKADPALVVGDVSMRVPILMYHHIRNMKPTFTTKDRLFTVTPEAFLAQMEGLKRAGYTTVTPRDLEMAMDGKKQLPKKSVLLTFDDGYREHATIVLPILRRLHLDATYFIISDAYHLRGYMTEEMVRDADHSELVTIADHTRHHVFLARMNPVTRAPEIVDSKKELETLLGHPVLDFAYPYGSWNKAVADEVRDAGYALGFGVRLGSLHTSSTRYQLRRIRVLNGENVVSLLDAFSKP